MTARIHSQYTTSTPIRPLPTLWQSWSQRLLIGTSPSLVAGCPNICSMWVVESSTPNSAPSTPQPHHQRTPSSSSLHSSHPPHPAHLATNIAQANPPFQPLATAPSISAAALPGQHISGRLSGVVSLTDILNLFAKATGLHPEDPEDARRRRRGSSSSSRGARRESLSLEVPRR